MIGGFSIVIGIALLAVGFGMQSSIIHNRNNNYDFNESYEDVKSIEMKISYGNVIIEEGDSFQIEAYNMIEKSFSSTLKDGVWKIYDNSDLNSELADELVIFDIHIPFDSWFIWNEKKSPKIVITLPPDFTAENMKINMDAGSITADNLKTDEANIEIGTGYFNIKNLTLHNSSNISVGAGELVINNINAKDITMENGVGVIKADGIITGDSYVKNGVGSILLKINGKEENYKYDIDCNIGSVRIDGKEYTNMMTNEEAKNRFQLDCDAGYIELDYLSDRQISAE
jgi:cytoskeletal protein CcmA (bactofilin family)